MTSILEIRNLEMHYETPIGLVRAVDNMSLTVHRGQYVGLIGESGCGKSSLALSILKLLPENARIIGGKILFNGEDIVPKSEREMQKIRWKRISMVFQTAMNTFNPVYRVADQIMEAIMVHEKVSVEEARERISRLFETVGLDTERAYDYPHEYSGGMKQLAAIAMALACKPDIIIMDEPTTALDVIVQDQILRKIKELKKKFDIAIIHISHDLSVIAETCDVIGVMYGGQLVEFGGTVEIFSSARHPYTNILLASSISVEGEKRELQSIKGKTASLIFPPEGCRFRLRCPFAKEICKKRPEFANIESKHFVACHLTG